MICLFHPIIDPEDKDIARFFSSRYGIKITHDEVRLVLMKGFSSRNEEDGFIDLCELTSALLIPFLLKANASIHDSPIHKLLTKKKSVLPDVVRKYVAHSKDSNTDVRNWEHREFVRKCSLSTELTLRKSPKVVSDVLTMMIHDSVGPVSADHPPPLEVRLLQRIFRTYGEVEMSNNVGLLNEMIEVAAAGLGTVSSASEDNSQKPRLVLDTLTFIRALTSDVLLYDVDSELETTTNEYDVFHTNLQKGGRLETMYAEKLVDTISRSAAKTSCDTAADGDELEDQRNSVTNSETKNSRPILKLFTSAGIDFFADTYRSKFLTCSLWIGFLFSYLSQTYFSASNMEGTSNDTYTSEILTTVKNWFLKGLTVGVVGLAYVGFGGLGNNISVTSIMPSIAAIITLTGFVLKYYFRPTNEFVFTPFDNVYWAYMVSWYSSLGFGCLIVLLHLVSLLRLAILSCLQKKERQYWIFSHPGVNAEARTKQAAAYKINRMVENAHKVHQTFEKGQESEKLHGRALLNFGKSFIVRKGSKTKEVGAIWAWREILSGESSYSLTSKLFFSWKTLPNLSIPNHFQSFTGRIFYQEGVWLSARAISANLYQIIAIMVLVIYLTTWVINQTSGQVLPQCTVDLCQNNVCVTTCQTYARAATTAIDGDYYKQLMESCVAMNCQCDGCGFSILPPVSDTV